MSKGEGKYAEKPFGSRTGRINLQAPGNARKTRRVSLCAFRRGSLTLEATLLLPFFLCAVTALLYLYAFTAMQARAGRKLMEDAQIAALTVSQYSESDPYIRLYTAEQISMPFSEFAFGQGIVGRSAVVRAWVGYTGESFAVGAAEEMVYMTPEGSVYHKSGSCSYLLLSVQVIRASSLGDARNLSGGKYAPCEYCVRGKKPSSAVYITNYGNSYHVKRDCQGLKRTVMLVPLSQVGHISCCSRCGGYR